MHLAFFRIPTGLALGAVAATCAGRIARSDKPDINFGVINSAVGFMGVVMAFTLPRAMGLDFAFSSYFNLTGIDGLYLVYGVCALFAVLIAFRTPHDNEQKSQAMDQSAKTLRVGWSPFLG